MEPYLGTRSNVLTVVLALSVSVSEKAQNNLGGFTHTIGSTRLTHISMQSSLSSDGKT